MGSSIFAFIYCSFMIGRLTKEEEVLKDLSGMNNSSMGEQTTSELTGDKLIQTFGCINCHGADLAGTNMGPALKGIKEFWSSRDNLINYLRNPNSFMDKDRFKEYKVKYPNGIMPSYGNKDVKI